MAALTVEILRERIHTIDDLLKRAILSSDVAASQIQYYVELAQKVSGEDSVFTRQVVEQWGQKQSFFSALNWIYIIATIIAVVAFGGIIARWGWRLIVAIPTSVWNVFLHIFTITVALTSNNNWFVFPACLGWAGAMLLTMSLLGQGAGWDEKASQILSGACAIVWSIISVIRQNSMVAWIAIMALESVLGFSVVTNQLSFSIGFTKDDFISRGTAASFFLLALGSVIMGVNRFADETSVWYQLSTRLTVIGNPLIFIGTFVFFTGLLIMSNRWYSYSYFSERARQDRQRRPSFFGSFYFRMQVLTLLSGWLSIYLGGQLHSSYLQSVGGTFFVLYLMSKYSEIRWDRNTWQLGLLGFAGLLYGAVYIGRAYPEYFLVSLG